MSANLNVQNGRVSFAFEGDRNDIWHKQGQVIDPTWTPAQTLAAANLNYDTVKIPAYVPRRDPMVVDAGYERVDNAHFIARADTGALLCDRSCSDVYKPHQNLELFETVTQYRDIDPDHWKLSTLGSIGNGARVFFTAEYSGGDDTVAGDKFRFYLLASTTHDMSGASIYQGSTIRVVCNNTFSAATAMPKGLIKVRHNTKFDKQEAGKQLAEIIKSFGAFKKVGDSMARVHMAQDAVTAYFKQLLEIPFDAKREDLSAKKNNQYDALYRAYRQTLNETDATVWAAFNGATRFIDHDRNSRGQEDPERSRFVSAQFGSGAQLKDKAWNLLLPLLPQAVAV